MNIAKINSINREIKRLNNLLKFYKLTEKEKSFIRKNISLLEDEIAYIKGGRK